MIFTTVTAVCLMNLDIMSEADTVDDDDGDDGNHNEKKGRKWNISTIRYYLR